jgi:hypothetical protein
MHVESLENRRLLAASVLNFDNVTASFTGDFVPQGYGGFTYSKTPEGDSDFAVESTTEYIAPAGTGYANGYAAPSGQYAAYNQGYATTTISRHKRFDFVGMSVASFTGFNAYQDTSARTLAISAFRKGRFVKQIVVALSSAQYDYVACNFNNVDMIQLSASGASTDPNLNPDSQNAFLFDNFTFTKAHKHASAPRPSFRGGTRAKTPERTWL